MHPSTSFPTVSENQWNFKSKNFNLCGTSMFFFARGRPTADLADRTNALLCRTKQWCICREKVANIGCKGVHCVDLGESFPTSIYYLLAKFGFDTAENELSKVCRSKQAIPTPGHKSGSGNGNERHAWSSFWLPLPPPSSWFASTPALHSAESAEFCPLASMAASFACDDRA